MKGQIEVIGWGKKEKKEKVTKGKYISPEEYKKEVKFQAALTAPPVILGIITRDPAMIVAALAASGVQTFIYGLDKPIEDWIIKKLREVV